MTTNIESPVRIGVSQCGDIVDYLSLSHRLQNVRKNVAVIIVSFQPGGHRGAISGNRLQLFGTGRRLRRLA